MFLMFYQNFCNTNEKKTTIKRYFFQSAKNDVLETNLFLYKTQKYTTLGAFHGSLFAQFFFVAVLTTFSALLTFRGMQWQIVRLKMVLMFSLWSSFLFRWGSAVTCVLTNQMGWDDGFVNKQVRSFWCIVL